ncbi:hypothetical protein GCM10010341_75810 [Streptomyces noursei]|nr:hypothetical protein GCM10010341_75810 [Streptomyces noursei]
MLESVSFAILAADAISGAGAATLLRSYATVSLPRAGVGRAGFPSGAPG